MNFSDDIITIKGIGEKSAPLFRKLGMNTVEDVINYFPRDYVYYEPEIDDKDSLRDDFLAIRAKVTSKPLLRSVRSLKIVTAKLLVCDVLVTATWFNMPYLTKSLTANKEYVFRGSITRQGDHFHMEQPTVFTLDQYEIFRDSFRPVYALTKGLSNNLVTKSVENALKGCALTDELIYKLHFPKDRDELLKAREHFVYEEFLLFILRLRMLKHSNEISQNDFSIIPSGQSHRLIEMLPFRLTNAQIKVFSQVEEDLCSSHSMSRLVQGDVGSGKTIIALLAAITVANSGYQVAIMAPTEILAAQHFEYFSETFKKYNINLKCILLTGSKSAKAKKEIYDLIAGHEVDIIIGTHALIQEKVVYDNLALVVTDEQHRFGVNQRSYLSLKSGESVPHVLVMSATPIPRTLAMMLYGDLDISVIDETPKMRLPIKNCVVGRDYRKSAYEFMRKEIEKGHQVYVITPLVEESEAMDVSDSISYTKKLEAYFGETIRVATLNGKMKSDAKNRVMNDFAKGSIDILVATTVVEVGVNVPNATVMLIEDADRFGLAQLHQLRGRIGRGNAQSYCIFLSGNKNPKNLSRLKILNDSNDGFYIASQDLKLRGPGDIFGIRQSGDIRFKLADIYVDSQLLKKASEDADRILKEDPELSLKEHEGLKLKIDKMFQELSLRETI